VPKPDVQQGTSALRVLKTLDVLGAQHGFGIAWRIKQISGDQFLSFCQSMNAPLNALSLDPR
jgi:hypothetical protein